MNGRRLFTRSPRSAAGLVSASIESGMRNGRIVLDTDF